MASKSDVDAKQAFIAKLLEEGYGSAEVKAEPSDIVATKNGETWYFEIKRSKRRIDTSLWWQRNCQKACLISSNIHLRNLWSFLRYHLSRYSLTLISTILIKKETVRQSEKRFR